MTTAEHLKNLELELLQGATRKNEERVSALLADEFREFGSSGRVYSKSEIIATLQGESSVFISAADVEVNLLGEHVALVTYRSMRKLGGMQLDAALRSSIWVKAGDRWTMIFHQGTKLA